MYGGVGIPSAKGTGTNGFVERALGYLPKDYKPGSYGEIIRQMKSNPAQIKRKINDEIILHEEKHKIEVELYDLKERYLKEKKYSEKEIEEKINNERKRLYHLLERREADFMDKNETHQKGKLKDAQMKIIKNALKIKEGYYLGEGFEYGLQADMDPKKKKSKKEYKKEKKKKSSKYDKDNDEYKHKKHEIRKKNEEKNSNSNDYSFEYEEKNDNNHKKRKKNYYKNTYYRENYYRERSSSQSNSRSRSRSKNFNRNIKNELNNDYRLNKKYNLAEPVFKRSPSNKREDNEPKYNEENGMKEKKEANENENIINNDINNDKEIIEIINTDIKINNLKENSEKNLNNEENKNKKEEEIKEEEKDDYEHEEGSINE